MQSVKEFEHLRKSFAELFDVIETIITKLHKDAKIDLELSDDLAEIKSDLKDLVFTIAVVGVIKRGKSTLLNALLKSHSEILSTAVTVETAKLSYLRYSEKPYAIIHMRDSKNRSGAAELKELRIDIDELHRYTSAVKTGFLSRSRGVKELVENTDYAEVYYPNEYLKNGVVIVDTPGVDDPDKSRAEITEHFVSKADAIILVLDVSKGGLNNKELQFLKARIINSRSRKGILVAFNKVLQLRKHEQSQLDDLMRKNQEKLEHELRVSVPVYPIDSLAAFEGNRDNDSQKYASSRFTDFLNALEKTLLDNKGRILMRKRIADFESRIVNPIETTLDFQMRATPDNLLELENEIVKTTDKLNSQSTAFKRAKEDFERQIGNLKAETSREIRRAFPIGDYDFTGNTDLQDVISVAIDDLNRRLTDKLKDTMKNFRKSLNANDIRIPSIDIQIENPRLDMNKFLVHSYEEKKGNKGASAAAGAGLGALIFGPIGALIGGGIGWFLGSETVQSEIVTLDEVKLRREVQSTINNIERSYIQEYDLNLDHFSEVTNRWFESRRHEIASNKESIEAAKHREISQHEKHRKIIGSLLDEIKSVKRKLSEYEKQLEIQE